MMLVRVEQLIIALFDQCMDAFGMGNPRQDFPDTYAQHFCLRISVENNGYEKDGNTKHKKWYRKYHRWIHVLVTSHRNVFVATYDEPYLKDVPASAWKNTSNHDSCWSSDGLRIFNKELGKAWEHCYGWMEQDPETKEHMPPNWYSMNMFTDFGEGFTFTKPLNFVQVTFGPYEDTNHRYFRKLAEVKPLEFEIVFKPT